MEGVRDPAGERKLYLMLAQAENFHAMNTAVIEKIVRMGCTPLVISVNQPYKVLCRTYRNAGLDPESFYVIDAVTQHSGGVPEPHPRVKFVTNPANLTDLGIAITEFLKQIPEERTCILFDSVSMLLIHIPTATASKFLHFVVNKLKLKGVTGIFLCVEKGLDPVIISQMSSIVDHVIDYDTMGTDTLI